MAVTLRQYNDLKATAERLQRDADRAEGALDEQMKILTKEGCDTIEEAVERLVVLQATAATAETEYDNALATFETEYSDVIAGVPTES